MNGEAAIAINENSVVRKSIYGKHVRTSDVILTGLIYLAAGISILLLIGIMGYVFVRGIPGECGVPDFRSQYFKWHLRYPGKYREYPVHRSDHSFDRHSSGNRRGYLSE